MTPDETYSSNSRPSSVQLRRVLLTIDAPGPEYLLSKDRSVVIGVGPT